MVLLPVAHAVPELRRLAEMIAEARTALADLGAWRFLDGHRTEGCGCRRRMHGAAAAQAVGKIGDLALVDGLAGKAVALVVVDRPQRAVDRQLVEVRARRAAAGCRYRRTAGPAAAGSLVKSMPGTTWPVWKATCSVSAKKLSGLRFSVILPTFTTGTSSSGMSLVAIEQVEAELVLVGFSSTIWKPSSHSGKSPRFDRLLEVAPVEVGVLAGDQRALPPRPASRRPSAASNGTSRSATCPRR